jgi:hypothetical protein
LVVIKDPANTAANRNLGGIPSNDTGQIPGATTRRDAHGVVATIDEKYAQEYKRSHLVLCMQWSEAGHDGEAG